MARGSAKAGLFLGTGLLLLSASAVRDFWTPAARFAERFPGSFAVLSSIATFVAAAFFIANWTKAREVRRLERISTIAYRALAQAANDAGRTLLAPLCGLDPTDFAIPSQAGAAFSQWRQPGDVSLPNNALATGSWRGITAQTHGPVLRTLIERPEFVRFMFRVTAELRRRIQDVTAQWAPIMLTSRASARDLAGLQRLSDSLELLQEHWRLSALIGVPANVWTAREPWATATCEEFWRAISIYESIRDEFAELARLPSDAIVRRRE